jgi:hypothetical protein
MAFQKTFYAVSAIRGTPWSVSLCVKATSQRVLSATRTASM